MRELFNFDQNICQIKILLLLLSKVTVTEIQLGRIIKRNVVFMASIAAKKLAMETNTTSHHFQSHVDVEKCLVLISKLGERCELSPASLRIQNSHTTKT